MKNLIFLILILISGCAEKEKHTYLAIGDFLAPSYTWAHALSTSTKSNVDVVSVVGDLDTQEDTIYSLDLSKYRAVFFLTGHEDMINITLAPTSNDQGDIKSEYRQKINAMVTYLSQNARKVYLGGCVNLNFDEQRTEAYGLWSMVMNAALQKSNVTIVNTQQLEFDPSYNPSDLASGNTTLSNSGMDKVALRFLEYL